MRSAPSTRPQVVCAVARQRTGAAAPPAPAAATPATVTAPLAVPRPATALYEGEQFDVPHTAPALHLVPQGPWAEVPGGVCAPHGFTAQGLHAGLRAGSTRADAALIVSDRPAAAAGCLSANPLAGASVAHTREALFHSQQARAVLMLQGQANIGTGYEGQHDARLAAAATATALGGDTPADSPAWIDPEQVLLLSGGQLGERLALDALLPALPGLASGLAAGAEAAYHAACALSAQGDSTTKEAALEVPLGGYCAVRLGGMAAASPSGVQAVVTCDAAVDPELWRAMFQRAAAASFGQLALCSGDCLNDSVLGLANGSAGNPPILEPTGAAAQKLEAALTALMQGLAKEVAWDGPAASCLLEVEVSGAECQQAARQAALAVARSARVRADMSCCKADWAGIACALGSSGVPFWPADLVVSLAGMPLFHHGRPTPDYASAQAYAGEVLRLASAKRSQVTIGIRLGGGPCSSKAWTFDQVFASEPCCAFK
ncbi:hypothetical protein ABPG75_011592 [Micractinium tetrahymenae]